MLYLPYVPYLGMVYVICVTAESNYFCLCYSNSNVMSLYSNLLWQPHQNLHSSSHSKYSFLAGIYTLGASDLPTQGDTNIFMSSCVGGSKAPPRTLSQQDTRCECYITSYECYIRNRFKPVFRAIKPEFLRHSP